MGIRRETERGFTALGKEFGAYRNLADEIRTMHRSGYRNLHWPLLGLVIVASRIAAEITAPKEYLHTRLKLGKSPEEIAKESALLIKTDWQDSHVW